MQKLLIEKPDVAGIAVPGMPIGSPGMESGDYTEPYTVFSFTDSGETDTSLTLITLMIELLQVEHETQTILLCKRTRRGFGSDISMQS